MSELAGEIERSRDLWERELAAGGLEVDDEALRADGTTFELVEYQLRAAADHAVSVLRGYASE